CLGFECGCWMRILVVSDMSTTVVGSTLELVYNVKDGVTFRIGPVYYMQKALGFRKLGIVFAILLPLCFGFIFTAVQSNTISQSFMDVFHLPNWLIGLLLVLATAIIIFGGV